jgi:hypothetical protein
MVWITGHNEEPDEIHEEPDEIHEEPPTRDCIGLDTNRIPPGSSSAA